MAEVPGYVYALRSAGHAPDLYKVGGTEKGPEVRARALSRDTGVPSAFEVVLSRPVPDWRLAENLLKTRLMSHRWSGYREFFKLSLDKLQAEMDEVAETVSKNPERAREHVVPEQRPEREAAQATQPRTSSEQLYFRYWSAFRDLLEARPVGLMPPTPLHVNFMNFYGQLPRKELILGAQTSTNKRIIKAYLMMKPDPGGELLSVFRESLQEIQRSLPDQLLEENQSERKEKRSFLWVEAAANSGDDNCWPDEHEWLRDRLDRLHRAVRPIADTLS